MAQPASTTPTSKEESVSAPAPSSPPKPLLALPPPPPHDPDAPIKLDVGTSTPVSLYDKLGPTIVASDGTLSRIGNWGEMDKMERDRVLRVLGARNQIRLEEKKAQLERENGQASEEAQ
ncbi:hypothetical protein BCR35DRAFT_308207 [Leucosporidium creatinivorum]|uniref:Uncharacterized protein n=1 Tax=Leucosporidium creatinivorum TaxID=106004 RepID=A0A1Y2ECY3_9BASI|nr:hypothetical protein BCR35DRAFT_308207 [Leucosporidium creatinivorum]